MLSPEETLRIRRKLEPNEQLVWCGKPEPRGFNRTTLKMMLFGIQWTAITGALSGLIVWPSWFSEKPDPLLSRIGITLCIIPFWAIAAVMLGAPFWRWLRQRRSLYAVTDKSALIVGALRTAVWRRWDIPVPDRADHRNGLTDIIFAETPYSIDGRSLPVGFLNLPAAEAAAAEEALKRLKRGSPGGVRPKFRAGFDIRKRDKVL